MRILHVFDCSVPLHSGYTFRSVALLRGQRALGWETFHLTSPKQGATVHAEETVEDLTFHRTQPVRGLGGRWPVVREWRLMRVLEARLEELASRLRPDIIHAHSPVLTALPALRIGARLGIPVVYEIRAFWEDAAVDQGTTREGSLRYRLTRHLETSVVRRCSHVFTICEGLRADIVARGIPADKVTLIPNAVDVEHFRLTQPPDPALQEKWGLQGRTVVGFVGSFYAYEGLDLLVDALPEVMKARPDVCLLLVGGGTEEAALKARVQALGLTQRVIFTGRVPHADINRYYDLIHLLAYPRHSVRLTELVTPLKPLEAMARGHLFVASEVGGHRELIEHGKTGWLFKADCRAALSQAIIDLLAHPEVWPRMRADGRKLVETVRNWPNSVANYRAAYDRVLKEFRP